MSRGTTINKLASTLKSCARAYEIENFTEKRFEKSSDVSENIKTFKMRKVQVHEKNVYTVYLHLNFFVYSIF